MKTNNSITKVLMSFLLSMVIIMASLNELALATADTSNPVPETLCLEETYSDNVIEASETPVITAADEMPGDPMVYMTQKWLNQEYGKYPDLASSRKTAEPGGILSTGCFGPYSMN